MSVPNSGDQVSLRTGSGSAAVEVVGVFPAPAPGFERQVAFKITKLDEGYTGVFEIGLGMMWPLSLFVGAATS